MQSLTTHSAYFESLCNKIKLFSHGRPDTTNGDIRRTYFRLNDAEEALAGQVSGMHFPALIHHDYAVKGALKGDAERLNVANQFWVLAQPIDSTADAIAAAYNIAELALQKLVRRMLKEAEQEGTCGPFQNLDIGMISWQAISGPELDNLYGFELNIREDQKATDYTAYNDEDYYEEE
jgi:hypothetical protein